MNKIKINKILKEEKEHKRIYDFYKYERKIKNKYSFVIGIDEVGRGSLAGPVCIACVCLPTGIFINGLNDSKKISEKKREIISTEIKKKAFFYSFGYSNVDEIEKYNISEAIFIAINRGLNKIKYPINYILLDGKIWPKNIKYKGEKIIKGDFKIASIAAASILAKVERDNLMKKINIKFPKYNFDKNKGYGTKEHFMSIKKFGISSEHRTSFLKDIFK